MTQNKLKLNDDKTEVIHFSLQRNETTKIKHISVGKSKIYPSNCVRNLGVQLDSGLSMEQQVQSICQNANFQLRNIGKIRNLIDRETCKLLVHSFVTSRLDYCNSLLFDVNDYTISKLQKIQNYAARIITRTKKSEHITPVLRQLHWLPIKERIEYKILLIVYKVINGLAPDYLNELITIYKPTRCLRSSSSLLLNIPHARSKFAERAFSVSAPRLWNTLSERTRSSGTVGGFKSNLKTELFSRAFGC